MLTKSEFWCIIDHSYTLKEQSALEAWALDIERTLLALPKKKREKLRQALAEGGRT